MGRNEYRLDDPTGAGNGPGQRHPRLRGAHRRRPAAGRRGQARGDRLDTDILGANRAGLQSALVLTGIDQAKQVLAAEPAQRPTYILDDLRQLSVPYPSAIETTDGAATVISVGTAVVRREGENLTVVNAGTPIDLLRAGTVAIWNSGVAIYGLRVPPELYS
jgi:glycerol 3-phosphatase-2